MKNTLAVILILVLGCSLHAQDRPSDRLFEKMALKQGITMLSFSKSMLDAVDLNFDNDDNEDGHQVTGDLNEVKVVIYNAPEDAETIDFRGDALRYLPLTKFKEIDPEDHDINHDNGSCDIRILKSGRKIKECHVLFQGETNGVLLSFFGDFKVEDVKELAEKVDSYK